MSRWPEGVVDAAYASGTNMSALQFFTFGLVDVGPRWKVTCGRCGGGFRARLPIADEPLVRCPCGQLNRIRGVRWTDAS